MNNKKEQYEHGKISDNENNEDLNLFALLIGLWRFKSSIIFKSGITIFFLIIMAALVYLSLPKFTVVKQPFSLGFSGVDKHQYPNGMHFSVNDIISTPVLQTVYNNYNLKKNCTFSEFKSSFIIKQRNYRLNNLEKEYNAKLSDKKLLYTERKIIEDDYAKRKAAMKGNTYYLVFINKHALASPIPKEIIPEILNDILKTWAEQSEKERHVLNYRNKLLSPDSIRDAEVDKFDYLITADILQMYLNNTLNNLNYILGLPGGDKIKIGNKTVNDYIFEMKKLKTFYLDQSIRAITTYALYKDKNLVKIYIDSRLVDLERNKNELEMKRKLYDTSIVNYTATSNGTLPASKNSDNKGFLNPSNPVITQLGDSFFDNIIALAQKGNDTQFRQNLTSIAIDTGKKSIEADKQIDFYKTFLKDIENTKKIPPELKKELTIKLADDFKFVLASMKQALTFANEAYEKISKQNFSPQAKLYDTTGEALSNITSSLSIKKLLVFSILFWMLISGIIIINVIVKNNLLASDYKTKQK
jgi:hypothetical protein